MLEIVHGNIFDHPIENTVLAHGCNAQGKMGAGFAKILKDKYLQNYLAYQQANIDEPLKLGEVIYTNFDRHIANVITQLFYGRDGTIFVDYGAITHGLRDVVLYAKKRNLKIILPFIGAGYGGGNDERLLSIFKDVFSNHPASLFLLDKQT